MFEEESVFDIDEDRYPSRSPSTAASEKPPRKGDQHRHDSHHTSLEHPTGSSWSNLDASQSTFPSDLLEAAESPFFHEATKPLPKQLTANAVEVVKVANVCAAAVGIAYFYFRGLYDVVLEYDQIFFLSILVNILDSTPGVLRTLWFVLIVCAGVIWTSMAVYVSTWALPVYHQVAWTLMAFFYDAGTISCAYVILHHPSRKLKATNFLEVDLLLYLVSLNAICIFPVRHFNSSLHLILDIRMIVLLYGGLYRPNDKVALLRRKSIWLIMACILVFFVLVSSKNLWAQFIGSIVNFGVGLTLLVQAALFHYVKYPLLRRLQAQEAKRQASSPGSFVTYSGALGPGAHEADDIGAAGDDRASAVAMRQLSTLNPLAAAPPSA